MVCETAYTVVVVMAVVAWSCNKTISLVTPQAEEDRPTQLAGLGYDKARRF